MREIRLVRGVEKESPKQEIDIPRGELKKPKNSVDTIVAKMEKIEKRTEHLLEKAKKQSIKSPQIKNESKQVKTHQEQFNRTAKEASLLEFYCLKGLPKIILRHIHEKCSFDESLGKWISIIDTEDLKNISNKTASHLSVQILRLEKQGWFKLLKSNNAGVRVMEVNQGSFPEKNLHLALENNS
jgi:hypothetical protein